MIPALTEELTKLLLKIASVAVVLFVALGFGTYKYIQFKEEEVMTKTLNDFLKTFVKEEDEPLDDTGGREQLINFIVQNFYRFINNPNMKDDRALLMLIAALATISAAEGNSPAALQAAKRLAQNALARGGKMKKEKKNVG